MELLTQMDGFEQNTNVKVRCRCLFAPMAGMADTACGTETYPIYWHPACLCIAPTLERACILQVVMATNRADTLAHCDGSLLVAAFYSLCHTHFATRSSAYAGDHGHQPC